MKTRSLFKSIVSMAVTISVILSLGAAALAVSGVPNTSFSKGDTIPKGTVIYESEGRNYSYIVFCDEEGMYNNSYHNLDNGPWEADVDYLVIKISDNGGWYDLYVVPYSDSGDSSDSPSLTPEQLRQMSVNAFVENLYERILGRTYDVTGRDYWVDQLMNQGATGADVVRGIIRSPEFNPGELTEEELVLELYNDLYHRVPSAGETAVWTGALKDGTSRESVLDFFLSTPEWASICAFYQVNP